MDEGVLSQGSLSRKRAQSPSPSKNSSNNRKGNMTSPESRDPKTRRTEHPTPEEIEEIDFKRNYMKIIEDLKQEVKNSLRDDKQKGRRNE